MNDIRILPEEAYGLGFVPPEFLKADEDEYFRRNIQLGTLLSRHPSSYRRLKPYEIETLVKNENSCRDWDLFRVSDPFTPELVKNNEFAGLVRIGSLKRVILEHHDMRAPTGITNSRVIACDIGDDCAIHDCAYLAHYIIGTGCALIRNDEINVSNHAKFGNGIVMEGESEEVRVELDLMNEAGGRSVLPFDGMICADAYLWARKREDKVLMKAFKAMTESKFDRRRGHYGTIGAYSVLKSNCIVKDVAVGECAYIKGANKLKNLTINSSEAERTQIGEGVELVNGIVGYGCRVFYGSKAVRFVMGSNSALKYGARLIHSVLGDNSTVSCCEMLNNLIFPAHEQHHNTSFLIASLVRGQSNMAAGATIGSNHNSRANDGEIEAGRGFWPGLSTSVKHSSRFASYCLLAKGDYRYEIDLPLPFCLVDDDRTRDRLVLVPAYWWTHNLYALMRNESKFLARDKRAVKVQHIEFSPFAPDTAEEILAAIALLEEWTGASLATDSGKPAGAGTNSLPAMAPAGLRKAGAARLDAVDSLGEPEVLANDVENGKRQVVVVKPGRARKAYREMLRWYSGLALAEWIDSLRRGGDSPEVADLVATLAGMQGKPGAADGKSATASRLQSWENLGGQLVPEVKVETLLESVRRGETADWESMHGEYARLASEYLADKAGHAWSCLARLGGTAGTADAETLRGAMRDLVGLSRMVEDEVLRTRKKDFENRFRRATFRSAAEMEAVEGRPETNSFVLRTRAEMEDLRRRAQAILEGL